jgi:DNA polymerase-3 subunit alpha
MWLKINYPAPFYANALRKADPTPKAGAIARLVRDAERHGVTVRGIDPHRSQMSWTVDDDGAVLAGWSQVEGIAEKTGEVILAERAKGPFTSWSDVERRCAGVGPKTVERLREAAASNDPAGVRRIADKLEQVRRRARRSPTMAALPSGEMVPVVGSTRWPEAESIVGYVGFIREIIYVDVVEAEHKRSGKAVEDILAELRDPDLRRSVKIVCYDDGDDVVTVRVNRWAYPSFERQVKRLRVGNILHAVGKARPGYFKSLSPIKLLQLDGSGA